MEIVTGEWRLAHQVALLAAHYDLNVEGDLASILPAVGGED